MADPTPTPAAPTVGVFLPTIAPRGASIGDAVAAARHAEAVGLDSVWVVDQLVAGTGTPVLDAPLVLAAAAGATEHVELGFGVLILPLRPVVWVAKQVASLQHLSGNRVVLGVGAGGDRHARSWSAAGVPRRERGRRVDEALRVLPDLIAGKPTMLDGTDGMPVELSPGTAVPPILVGGMSDAALRRTVQHADGWFSLPLPPNVVAEVRERLLEGAAAAGRPVPSITGAVMTAIDGDPTVLPRDELLRSLTDPDGKYGMPAEAADELLLTGDVSVLAERLDALRAAGAERVVVDIAGGDWFRQVELVAEARRLLGDGGGVVNRR